MTDRDGRAARYFWDPVGNLLSIERIPAETATLLQLTPSRGAVGSTVRIQGTGFGPLEGDNVVRFNDTVATVSSSSRSELITQVPAGATSGPVTVTTPTGSAGVGLAFTVENPHAPTLTAAVPNVAKPDDLVGVQGSNFFEDGPSNLVRVNATRAEVRSATASLMQVTVPDGVGSGRIDVTTPDGSATGPDLFIPPIGYSNADVVDTGRLTPAQPRTFTISQANKVAMATFDAQAGQWVSLRGITSMSTPFKVMRPDNTQLSSGAVGPTYPVWDAFLVPSTGTYSIVFDPTLTATGSIVATLFLAGPPELVTPTPAGVARDIPITGPGLVNGVAFAGTAGQRIAVRSTDSTVTGSLAIRRADGTGLVSRSLWAGEVFLDTYVLPADGIYHAVIDPLDSQTGSARLTVYDVEPNQTGTLTPTPTGASRALTFPNPGQNARLPFDGQAGQWVSLKATDLTAVSHMRVLAQTAPSSAAAGSRRPMAPLRRAYACPRTARTASRSTRKTRRPARSPSRRTRRVRRSSSLRARPAMSAISP